MKKRTIYTWSNPRPPKKTPEMGPSVTIPEQTMSIRTIMERHARGMPLDVHIKKPIYHNGEFPDIQKMDISEIEQLKRQTAFNIAKMKGQLQDQEDYRQMIKQQEIDKKLAELEQLKQQMNKEQKKDS